VLFWHLQAQAVMVGAGVLLIVGAALGVSDSITSWLSWALIAGVIAHLLDHLGGVWWLPLHAQCPNGSAPDHAWHVQSVLLGWVNRPCPSSLRSSPCQRPSGAQCFPPCSPVLLSKARCSPTKRPTSRPPKTRHCPKEFEGVQ
jgi:hypothetical protein